MKPHALLAALLTHALTHAAPPPLQTPVPYLPAADAFEYDYSADVEAQEAILVQATTPPTVVLPPRDPLADAHPTPFPLVPSSDCTISAREMAKLNIMDRILIALGPPFGEKLPKAPNSDTLATVPTPINITTEPCPYKYKRCSSQTYFPSCDIPRNTAPEIWPQRFNLFFNLSADFDSKLDVINATLRLYKNNSLPLQRPKTLLIKAFVYTRSLTRRRNKTKLVADTQISSDYLGWVTLSVTEIVKRWKKQKNNHGVLITVNDVDDIPWDAPRIFVTMDCASGLVPLPFEVQTEQEGQQYPALNVRLGSPDDEPDAALSSSPPPPPPTPSIFLSTLPPPFPTMQGDDPGLYEYNYEADLEEEEDKEREVEGLVDEVEDVENAARGGDRGGVGVEEAPTRPFHTFYNLHARARGLHVNPTTPSFHHLIHHHTNQGPPPPPPPPHHLPTHTTPLPPPPDHSTAPPAPTPPVVSFRVPQGRRGTPRHRRKHRGGHRRG